MTSVSLLNPAIVYAVTESDKSPSQVAVESDKGFYVRDDLADTPENRVYTGRITLGLFGTVAPVHVREFLRYVTVPYDPLAEDPLPGNGRGVFTRLDQSGCLLEGGTIPGLEVTSVIAGASALRHSGRILPSPLWIETPPTPNTNNSVVPVSHCSGKGLLTHRSLDLTPAFGITTRPNAELDATHFVFDRLLLEDKDTDTNIEKDANLQFLRVCQDIPTYSMDRPVDNTVDSDNRAKQQIASAVFAKQQEIFRGATKTMGDTRLDKVYEGKLLRQVTVSKVGLLE